MTKVSGKMSASKALLSTGEPAYAVDHFGAIVTWNPAAEQAFGYAKKEAVGQHCWELLVHLCCPECEAGEACTTMFCTNPPSANYMRGALTGREKEVLMLLSEGKSTQDVAADMCIRSSTVRNHTQHILHKLHVHSRVAAINLGQKLGLI